MDQENLNITVIYGAGRVIPALPELLTSLPQVKATEQIVDVKEFLQRPGESAPDTLLVYLDGSDDLPEWIENITLKYPQAPLFVISERTDREFLLRAMHLGVREVLAWPISQDEVQAALDRVRGARRRVAGPSRSTVVAVAGQKGGVGATVVAINLALALAELQGERCALVDLGRPFPDIGNFLDQVPCHDLSEVFRDIHDLDQSFFTKIMQPYEDSLAILHGISDFKEQDNINVEGVSKVFKILRSLYKHIVVDLGHIFDDLFFQVFNEADLVLMVTELNVPNFRNLKKFWALLKDWGPSRKKIKIIINRYEKNDDLGMDQLEKVLEEPPLAILPADHNHVHMAINQGVPLEKLARRSKLYLGLQDIAQKIAHSDAGEEKGANGSQPHHRFWIF